MHTGVWVTWGGDATVLLRPVLFTPVLLYPWIFRNICLWTPAEKRNLANNACKCPTKWLWRLVIHHQQALPCVSIMHRGNNICIHWFLWNWRLSLWAFCVGYDAHLQWDSINLEVLKAYHCFVDHRMFINMTSTLLCPESLLCVVEKRSRTLVSNIGRKRFWCNH